jgi:flagellar biosynthesis protein FlhG
MTAAAIDLRPVPSPLEKRLITIGSGKGGVGKTWLSVSLAYALAQKGRRVLLFDGDLGLANVDIQLGLTPQADIGDVLAGRHSLAEAITPFADGSVGGVSFDVLAGQSGTGAFANLGRDALIAIRQRLIMAAGGYDHVLLDLGAGIEQSVAILAHHGGRTLVVVTPEPTALTDAYAFIKLRRMRDPAARIGVVVNQADTRRAGEQTFETLAKACASFLGFRPGLAGIIRRDPKIPDSIRAQLPVALRYPTTAAVTDLDGLATDVIRAG